MKLNPNFFICNDKGNYFFVHDQTKQIIPKKYEIILHAIENAITDETEIMDLLIKSNLSETEAAILCADFITEYSDELASE